MTNFIFILKVFSLNLVNLLGYFLANVCLKLYVIPGMEVTIKEGDPNWIGAWWLGFPVIGTCIFLFAGNS